MKDQQLQTEDTPNSALETAKQKTREHAKALWQIISKHSNTDRFAEESPEPATKLESYTFKNKGVLKFLSVIPYLLFGLFVLSFFWDFNAISWEAFGYILQFDGLLKILSVSGLIGFLTNWLAITMLFKPAQKRPLLGHGLIPAQKDRIAFRMAQAVSEDLINPEIIKQKINESGIIGQYREQGTLYIKGIIDDPEFRYDLKKWVVQYVNEMIANPEIRGAIAEKIIIEIEESIEEKSFEKVALKAYSYIKGQEMQHIIEEALTRVPTSVESGLNKMDNLLDQLPSKLEKHSEAIENIVTNLLHKLINQLDVHALVEDNLRGYDEQHISNIIKNATNEQLHYIQYLGAVLGMIGGLVIWEPIISTVFLGLMTLLILSLDNLLVRFQSRA
jgi:uncharacterized membrane-anchored protein YjiN (DUF445 family)